MPSACGSILAGAVAGRIRPEDMLATDPRRDTAERSMRGQTYAVDDISSSPHFEIRDLHRK
jgi:hypothetical protein